MSYYWYFENLKQPGLGPFHEDEPQPGFYRVRRAKGSREWFRVAIWLDGEGKLQAIRNDQPVNAHDVWLSVMRNPVAEDVWRAVASGGEWPDAAPAAAVPGHNLPADDNERLRLQYEAERERVEVELRADPVASEDQATKLAEWKLQVVKMQDEAEALRKAEKKPVDEQAKAIQRKWVPLVDGFALLAGSLDRRIKDYLKRKAAIEEEARRAAAEAAAKEGIEGAFNLPPVATTGVVTRVGSTGAKVSLRKVEVAVISDMQVFLIAQQNHPFIKEAAERCAAALVRAKTTSPGLSTRIEEK